MNSAKLTSFINRLNKITDPDELERQLDKLTDEQFAIYKAQFEKPKPELVYATTRLNYIKRRHRAYLWLFRMQQSVDIAAGVVTIIHYKYAFGKMFVLGETIRKFEIC